MIQATKEMDYVECVNEPSGLAEQLAHSQFSSWIRLARVNGIVLPIYYSNFECILSQLPVPYMKSHTNRLPAEAPC
jgi:hypothetical protein